MEEKNYSDDQIMYHRARKRVEELKGFYTHAMVYVFVNICLFLLNYLTSPGQYWFYWPALGWGIGLTAHALGVFGSSGILGTQWEERKIQEYMEKEKNRKF